MKGTASEPGLRHILQVFQTNQMSNLPKEQLPPSPRAQYGHALAFGSVKRKRKSYLNIVMRRQMT